MNRIILIGNLTRDPELKYSPAGVPVAKFGMAVNRTTKNPQGELDVDFFNLTAFRQQAEFISQYASKGKKLAVEGKVQMNSFVGQDGTKKFFTDVIVDHVELLSPREGTGGGTNAPMSVGRQGAPASSSHESAAPSAEVDDFADPFTEP